MSSGEKISPSDFTKIQLLGKGNTGKVYLVALKGTNPPLLFAMKVLTKKDMIKRHKVKRVLTEREVLATAAHPFIVTLHYSFQSENKLYFVMDYCPGGEFYRILQKQPNKRLPEKAVRFYACEILLALEYLHFMGFIHRDLKPENILMDKSGHLKLTDFDLSKSSGTPICPKMISSFLSKTAHLQAEPTFVAYSFVGTAEYIAPEILGSCGYTATVDWWTFGILIYEMLYGKTPYCGHTKKETFDNIEIHHLKFPSDVSVTHEVKNLLKHLLDPNPGTRLGSNAGASDIKEHPWFSGVNWGLIRNQEPPIIPTLKHPLDTHYFQAMKDNSIEDVELISGNHVSQDPFIEFTDINRGPKKVKSKDIHHAKRKSRHHHHHHHHSKKKS